MNISFKGKRILITGGTRGLGEAMAIAFERSGGEVFITGTGLDSFEKFKRNNPETITEFIQWDFLEQSDYENKLLEINSKKFDILVNNAGINRIAKMQNISVSDFDDIQKVNVRTPFVLTQEVMKNMSEKKWGRIINIGSIFGVVTKEERLSYTTSKYAIIGMTKSMALDLANDNILVNCISPGFIDTELTREVLGEKGIEEMISKVPLGRLGSPDDISNLVLFLSSDLNSFSTGQNFIVDGGFTCA